jgi:hypothetical protein
VTAAAHAWTPEGWGALPAGQVQGPSARHLRPVTGISRDYEPETTGKQANAQIGTLGQLPATLEVPRWQVWSSPASRCPTMPLIMSASGGAHGAPSHDTSMRNLVRYGPDCIRRDAGLGRGRSRLPAPGRGSGGRRCRRPGWPLALAACAAWRRYRRRPGAAPPSLTSVRCGPPSRSRSRGPRSSRPWNCTCICTASPPRTSPPSSPSARTGKPDPVRYGLRLTPW